MLKRTDMGKKIEFGEDVLLRLKAVREHLGLTQKEMGEKIMLKRTSYSSIEQGHNSLTAKHIQLLHDVLKVRKEYLLHGEEPMFYDAAKESSSDRNVMNEDAGRYEGKKMVDLEKKVKELKEEIEMYKGIIKKMLEK